MINTISDLLKSFVEAEKSNLNKYDITHRPTIGEMYEGLTKNIVEKSIFYGLNLVVTTQSFIEGCDTEFDVILSEGDGAQIPYTTSYRYKPSQVIAVIQVKKTLNSQELRNSYDNLKQVADVYQKYISSMDGSMVRDSFKNICHKEIEAYEKGQLSLHEEYIYHSLVMDCYMPLRIILGYNGYKTEEGLRSAFINFLYEKKSTEDNMIPGYSPLVMPNLIISDGFSLAKLTGCPYCSPLGEVIPGWWELIVSSHFNSMKIFLEMLWTKLSYRFHTLPQDIFGEDLEFEPMSAFIRAKIHSDEKGQPRGWDYEYSELKEKQLQQNDRLQPWEPAVVDKAQYVVLQELGRKDIDIVQDKDLTDFVTSNGYSSLEEFISSLQKLGFVTLDGNNLRLITRELACVICPNGKSYAADNYDGRLERWMSKNHSDIKTKFSKDDNTVND